MFNANPTIAIDILGQANVMIFMLLVVHKRVKFKLTGAASNRIPITGESSTNDRERNQNEQDQE
jgi:hypothetical protein